ncbi:MAG: thiol-disulfide isomerase [Terriglobales bacterium]
MVTRAELRRLELKAALVLALTSLLAHAQAPAFYREVLPILQQHCQLCHRPGEIGPMPLMTYAQVHPYAAAIAKATAARVMPPWFAVPGIGKWQNDPSLSPAEIATLAAWARAGAPAGDVRAAPPPSHWTSGWNISSPDAVIRMPRAVSLPARGEVAYTYEIVPTGFVQGHWVQAAEIRPSSRAHVHHAVVYVRPPGSSWLKGAPVGVPFSAPSLLGAGHTSADFWTDSEILLVYAPGSAPDRWPASMGKFVPAGSDLVFQMHYTTNGHPARDQTSLGLVFNRAPPAQRVLTLQLTNDRFIIPPGVDNFRVEVHGTLPGDATLLSLFPHMHLRGKRFEYNLVRANGSVQPLLRVNYNFYWQRSYRLAMPLPLKAGTELQAVGWYDNSSANPHNPDPEVAVRWGEQTSDEMMVGFFDLAVPAGMDKWQYFAQRF